jgi:hypothetical protein
MDAKTKATLDSFKAKMTPKGGPREEPETGKILATLKRQDGTELRVALREFQGKPWVDLRIWQPDGERMSPTKKGLGLKTRELPEVVEALVAAMENLQAAS